MKMLRPTPIRSYDRYVERLPGGRGLTCATRVDPLITTSMLSGAGLRDRGTGAFVGQQWVEQVRRRSPALTVVCDATDPDPTSFTSRALLNTNPYQVLEGLLIAGITLTSTDTRIVIDASWHEELRSARAAVADLERRGLTGGHRIEVVRFAGRAGQRHGRPRLYSGSRISHRPETFAQVANVAALGAGWFRRSGTAVSPGTAVLTVLGDLERPSVIEVPFGGPLRDVIATAAGSQAATESVKAVLCGIDARVLAGTDLDVRFSHEGFAAVGTSLGASGLVVVDATTCMVDVARSVIAAHIDRTCSPRCRQAFERLASALATPTGQPRRRISMTGVREVLHRLERHPCCETARAAERCLTGIIARFGDEFATHAAGRRCDLGHGIDLLHPGEVTVTDGGAHHRIEVSAPPQRRPGAAVSQQIA